MKIFITGATGLVGGALTKRLLADGHEVTVWVRTPAKAVAALGPAVGIVEVASDNEALGEALSTADAVVNLAGAPVAQRWSDDYRKTLVRSRVDLTQRLVDVMGSLSRQPSVLVSASAVGFYGDRGDERLTEESAPGEGFLASLCVDWEAATMSAQSLGIRACCLRLGIVLSDKGGALDAMRRPFSMGLGAVLGSGDQYSPFIHIDDLVEMLLAAVQTEGYRGPINAVAPAAVTQREFAKELASVMHRPAFMRVPAFALRLAMGDAASILLEGQRVVPKRATDLGFAFRFGELRPALEDVLRSED